MIAAPVAVLFLRLLAERVCQGQGRHQNMVSLQAASAAAVVGFQDMTPDHGKQRTMAISLATEDSFHLSIGWSMPTWPKRSRLYLRSQVVQNAAWTTMGHMVIHHVVETFDGMIREGHNEAESRATLLVLVASGRCIVQQESHLATTFTTITATFIS